MKKAFLHSTIFILLLFSCESNTMQMSTSSMEPIIKKGAEIRIDYTAFDNHHPDRWDIVAYEGPNKHLWLHRVVGLPEEELIIKEDGIYINSNKIDIPNHLSHLHYIPNKIMLDKDAEPPFKEYIVEHNAYFLLGDNSRKSYDSRMFGSVSKDMIRGKVAK